MDQYLKVDQWQKKPEKEPKKDEEKKGGSRGESKGRIKNQQQKSMKMIQSLVIQDVKLIETIKIIQLLE